MEELYEIRSCIEQGRYAEALNLLGEVEEMSKDDKISKIESYLEILLLHLIKQQAEKRTTRSWDVSIQNAIDRISYTRYTQHSSVKPTTLRRNLTWVRSPYQRFLSNPKGFS
jgi:hypothetical protein